MCNLQPDQKICDQSETEEEDSQTAVDATITSPQQPKTDEKSKEQVLAVTNQ